VKVTRHKNIAGVGRDTVVSAGFTQFLICHPNVSTSDSLGLYPIIFMYRLVTFIIRQLLAFSLVV